MNIKIKADVKLSGLKYEAILKRGFQFDKRLRRSHKAELINLINAENSVANRSLGTIETQLASIKNRLTKALDLINENLPDHPNNVQLRSSVLFAMVDGAKDSTDIIKVIDRIAHIALE